MKRHLAAFLALVLGTLSAHAKSGCPDPTFERKAEGWEILDPTFVRPEPVSGGPEGTALFLDGRPAPAPPSARSTSFVVKADCVYDIGGLVQMVEAYGHETFTIAVIWLDKAGGAIRQDGLWQGVLFGRDWTEYRARVIAPTNARRAAILLSVAPGSACRMTRLFLTQAPEFAPSVHVALMPEPLRPGTESRVRIRIQNMSEQKLRDVVARIVLPNEMSSSVGSEIRIGALKPWAAYSSSLTVHATAAAPDAHIRVEVAGRRNHTSVEQAASARFATLPRQVECSTASLPTPVSPPKELRLGCWYFPPMVDWASRPGPWQCVRSVENLEPMLGYYNEALPDVADWHVQWAASHGIDFFVFDWYYNQGNAFLNDALDDGFLKSRFRDQMQFAIHWVIQQGTCDEFKPYDFSERTLSELAETLSTRYFSRPNYVRIDGKPVLFIYQPWRIVNFHGDSIAAHKALDAMRDVAKAHGEPGLYIVAVHNSPWFPPYEKAGFDSVTAYSFLSGDLSHGTGRVVDYEAVLPEYARWYEAATERARARGIPYIPTAWAGWDDTPRAPKSGWRTPGNDAAAQQAMYSMLLANADPRLKLALVESWNEWGEGGAIEPGKPHGFGSLAALRAALTPACGAYDVPVPPSCEKAGFACSESVDQMNARYRGRYANTLNSSDGMIADFSSNRSLWFTPSAPHQSVARIVDGALRGASGPEAPILVGPPDLKMDAQRIDGVEIRLSVSAGATGRLYWTTEAAPGFSRERSMQFALEHDGLAHTYKLDLHEHPEWRGTVTQFRLDPMDTGGTFALYRFATVGRQAT